MSKKSFRTAITEAIRHEMERDPTVIFFGEDIVGGFGGSANKRGASGGIMGTTVGLYEQFGEKRIFDTPISESAIMGAAAGAALTGLRPIAELMFADFLGVCFDQIFNQAAKFRYMFGGNAKTPMVIRMMTGAGFGAAAQHSQALWPIFTHIPGLKVVLPSNPYDAKGLLIAAIRDGDPVIFLEHKVMYDDKGKALSNPDIYVPADQPGYTGYNADRDKGLQIVLKANNQNKVSPSFYNPWDLPGSSGADDYRDNIANCNTAVIPIGDPMIAEPGNMVGPTVQGTDDLVAKDPGAYWDTSCNCVKGSAYGISPRVAVIPVYDPVFYAEGKQNGKNAALKIANYVGFFIEGTQGNQVIGRITPVGGVFDGNAGPAPTGAFPVVIRLVQ